MRGALGLAAAYLAICATLFFAQRAMLFPAPRTGRAPKNLQVIELPGGGLMLYRAPPSLDSPVVIHFHGNGEQAADMEPLADVVPGGLALVEYPGYGLLAGRGSPSEASLLDAGQRAMDYLNQELHIPRERCFLSGQSLGSGVAVELARRGLGAKLLLFTPYPSLPDVAARLYPWVPVRLLMRDKFDSAAKAAGISIPVLIVHGTADEVIPFELGQRLSQLFPHAELFPVPGGHHNGLWDHPEVLEKVRAFLR